VFRIGGTGNEGAGGMAARSNVIVVGGGIIGLATAYRLSQVHPDERVTVLEKEDLVGKHQSTHNSGVLHAGLYYKPGSLKARMAVNGIRQMVGFCREFGIAHEICGKLVVATNEHELGRLEELHQRGMANGLTGLRRLSSAEAREREPNVTAVAAIEVPEEGIADYRGVCDTLAEQIRLLGGEVVTGAEVLKLSEDAHGWHVETSRGEFQGDFLVNCAGLHVDRIARMAGHPSDVRIVPFRGEYYKLRSERQSLVRHLIYPVPDPAFPFLGVHFTRMIGGGVEAGPNAVLALSREGYRWRDVSIHDTASVLAFPGMWRFLRAYPKMVGYELYRSASKRAFTAALQRLVPAVQRSDLVSGGAGVRAQAMHADGTLLQDFHIERRARALHLLNAPSPGATASLAIADHLIAEMT
jgi:L-2-hydroxyglutarate oxidase